jgi:hypothetical protein
MIKIIDGFLPPTEWKQCLECFKGDRWSFPPMRGQINKTSVWRIFDPTIEYVIGSILYKKLSTLDVIPLAVKRVGINGATTFNESHCHVDGPLGDYSLIWFASEQWQKDWDGQLRVYNDDACWLTPEVTKKPNEDLGVTEIDYIPNRAILFPAHLAHIPVTPNITAKSNLRLSVGLHLTPANSWNYIYTPRT